jgi:hypothetical protein
MPAAERATRLGERQARLARQLIDLNGELARIDQARRDAEQAIAAHFTTREAALAAREAAAARRDRHPEFEPVATVLPDYTDEERRALVERLKKTTRWGE